MRYCNNQFIELFKVMATDPQSFVPPKSSWETVVSDEILDELHAFREAYAAQFDYDIDRMFADIEKHSASNPARRSTLKPLEPKPNRES